LRGTHPTANTRPAGEIPVFPARKKAEKEITRGMETMPRVRKREAPDENSGCEKRARSFHRGDA